MTVQYCLHCGLEFKAIKNNGKKQIYCSVSCQRKSSNQRNKEVNRIKETQFRNELSDRVVKRNIYIGSKGRIAYDQMTPEMIVEKRKHILEWRNRERKPKRHKKIVQYCKLCGKQIDLRYSYCSDECRKRRANNQAHTYNKSKKLLKARPCKECGIMFTPEYGDMRRIYCSNLCLTKYFRRIRRSKERARLKDVFIEGVDPIKVFGRDSWRCQLCGKKLKRKDRGTIKDNAPELDHIVPLSKGGEHSYRNTQCACRKCNELKLDKEQGQIRLFG